MELNRPNQEPQIFQIQKASSTSLDFFVSVICCTRNREKFVRRHFNAISKLAPSNVELIYALDHCNDGTKHFLERAAQGDPRVKIIENTLEPGLFSCRNFAIDHANGRFIHYLDDDDSVSEDFYTYLANVSEISGDADLIITDLIINVEGSPPYHKKIVDQGWLSRTPLDAGESIDGDIFEALLTGHLYFNCANTLFNRRIFSQARFRPEIRKTADYLFYLETFLKNRIKIVYFSEIVAHYFVHAKSMSIASDKSYWNMRAAETLYMTIPRDHSSRDAVRSMYGRALFDAGYAERLTRKHRAFFYYCKSMLHGSPRRPIEAALKLFLPEILAQSIRRFLRNKK